MKGLPESIAILDDHPLITNGLKSVFMAAKWPTKIHLFQEKEILFSFLKKQSIDIFLIDIQLRNTDGRDVIQVLKATCPKSKFIAISSFEDPLVIRSAFAKGADNYIVKSIDTKDLLKSIVALWNGKKVFQQSVTDAIQFKESQFTKFNIYNIPHLTPREKEILSLIIAEKTTQEIAIHLCLSSKTIESHRSNLFLKFDVKNVAGLVKKTLEMGLLRDK